MTSKKLLILKLDGDCDRGFDIEWEIGKDDGQRLAKNGKSRLALPRAPELIGACTEWYSSLRGDRIKPIDNSITNVRYTDLLSSRKQIADRLATLVNDWFDRSPLSRLIHQDLLTNCDDEYRVVICTEDPLARKIPWFLWQGWQQFHHLQISLGVPYTQRHDRIYQQRVRILAVLGDDTGINIEVDLQILAAYNSQGAEVVFLPQPTIEELRNQLGDERGWDILSFSGHSRTEKANYGRIFLNPTASLTMGELRTELTMAIDRGLQIAIFNSCDGLGIAAELESLHIPQVIVMRQPVADIVAQTFLKDFLAEFSDGVSFYQSVRIAQDRLREIEAEYPCASWLPTIIQNQLETPPTWQSLGSMPRYPYEDTAIENGQWVEMSRQELIKAIISPAHKLNIQFEDGLIDKIIDAVARSKNQWGLIEEFILRPLWERQENGWLTHRGYQEIGGVERVLASHAATTYDLLTSDQQDAVQNIFVQLIRFDRGKPICRTANQAEIGEHNWRLVKDLVAKRLVVYTDRRYHQAETIELIHESLINHWKVFEVWIDNHQYFRHWQEQLRFTISQWEKTNRDKGGLLQGKSLIVATERIASKYSLQISSLEKDFIDRSLRKRQRDDRVKVRVYWGFILLLIGFIAAISLFLFQMINNEQLAVKNNINSLRQNAELLLGTQQSAALIKAEDAVTETVKSGLKDSDITLPALLTLSDILDRIDEKKVWQGKDINPTAGAAYTQDGKNIVAIGGDNQLKIYDLKGSLIEDSSRNNGDILFRLIASSYRKNIISSRSLKTLRSWQQLTDKNWSEKSNLNVKTEISAMALSSDDMALAVAIKNKKLRLYSDFIRHPDRYQKLPTLDYIYDLKFTPDGQKIVTAHEGSIKIWTRQGELLNSYAADSDRKFMTIAINSQGKSIATGDNLGVVTLLDINGKFLKGRKVGKKILNLSFHPTQDLVAIATEDPKIELWNIKNNIPESLSGHTDKVESVDFSPDGKTLISASVDRTIRFWDIPDSSQNRTSNRGIDNDRASFSNIRAFNYNISGDRLVLARSDRKIQIIDTKNLKVISNFQTKDPIDIAGVKTQDQANIAGVSISKDSNYIATSDFSNEVTLWTTAGKKIKTFAKDFKRYHCVFSPTELILAIAANNKVGIYDIDGKLVDQWNTQQPMPTYLNFNADGSRLIIGDSDGNVKSWDMNGKSRSQFRNLPKAGNYHNSILDISYSNDGENIAIASNNLDQGEVSIWSASGKQRISILNSLARINTLSFSPDGKILLTGNKNGELQLWNLQGKLLNTIKYSHDYEIDKVRFKPNSLEFVVIDSSQDRKMSIYKFDTNQLLDRSKQWQQLTK